MINATGMHRPSEVASWWEASHKELVAILSGSLLALHFNVGNAWENAWESDGKRIKQKLDATTLSKSRYVKINQVNSSHILMRCSEM